MENMAKTKRWHHCLPLLNKKYLIFFVVFGLNWGSSLRFCGVSTHRSKSSLFWDMIFEKPVGKQN